MQRRGKAPSFLFLSLRLGVIPSATQRSGVKSRDLFRTADSSTARGTAPLGMTMHWIPAFAGMTMCGWCHPECNAAKRSEIEGSAYTTDSSAPQSTAPLGMTMRGITHNR